MSEIEEVKNDVKEIKGDIKDLTKNVNALNVFLAGNYVTKEEFTKHEEKDEQSHNDIKKEISKLVTGVSAAAILFLLGVVIQFIVK